MQVWVGAHQAPARTTLSLHSVGHWRSIAAVGWRVSQSTNSSHAPPHAHVRPSMHPSIHASPCPCSCSPCASACTCVRICSRCQRPPQRLVGYSVLRGTAHLPVHVGQALDWGHQSMAAWLQPCAVSSTPRGGAPLGTCHATSMLSSSTCTHGMAMSERGGGAGSTSCPHTGAPALCPHPTRPQPNTAECSYCDAARGGGHPPRCSAVARIGRYRGQLEQAREQPAPAALCQPCLARACTSACLRDRGCAAAWDAAPRVPAIAIASRSVGQTLSRVQVHARHGMHAHACATRRAAPHRVRGLELLERR